MAKSLQDVLIDKMYETQEQYEAILEVRAENRSTLNSLIKQGILSEEQAEQVREVYPERNPRKSPEERAADLEAQAQALREKAQAA